jgi:surfeit locus 1 family protein
MADTQSQDGASMSRGPRPSPLRGRWLILTVLVAVVFAVFIRLGFWQLERLGQRRAANERMLARLLEAPLDVQAGLPDAEAADLRRATVRGTYDYDQEFVLRNRALNEQPGVHVITPLRITGADTAILVDRGWIPYDYAGASQRSRFARPQGEVEVTGILRRSVARRGMSPEDAALGPDRPRLDAWHRVDIPRIQGQVPYPLLPVYLEATPPGCCPSLPGSAPRAASAALPTLPRPDPDVQLDAGSHLYYAIQWFAFAAILAGVYAALYRQSGGSRDGPRPDA